MPGDTWSILIPAIALLITAVANLIQGRVNSRKLDTAQHTAQGTSDLVNGTNGRQTARIEQLSRELAVHGHPVPPDPNVPIQAFPEPPGKP